MAITDGHMPGQRPFDEVAELLRALAGLLLRVAPGEGGQAGRDAAAGNARDADESPEGPNQRSER